MSTADSQPALTLYTAATPNGWKIAIALEELGIPYKTYLVNLFDNEQKQPWFLKINPNGRVPAITDHKHGDFNVFESGAILHWLVENYDSGHKLWPQDSKHQSETMQWLMFQMGGVGPMQGQAGHFVKFAPEKVPYGIKRYTDETKRLYGVLNDHLKGKEYLVNNQLTIADIANFSWILIHGSLDIDIKEFPHLKAWLERILARPAVKRGLCVPVKHEFLDATMQKAGLPTI
ncbi:Glutathione S-transferase 2 [Dispira parvispora]|uniref:Glutathione S-transferase 2 n=1 Tax=Dispira parvispora TaxID=1520584 RepID=A0A9W8E6P7_9FUNG|nr:Glutathione S-transferase 2 [Dispira parvispora]